MEIKLLLSTNPGIIEHLLYARRWAGWWLVTRVCEIYILVEKGNDELSKATCHGLVCGEEKNRSWKIRSKC